MFRCVRVVLAGLLVALVLPPLAAVADTVETFVSFSVPIEEVNVGPDGTLYLPSPGLAGAVKKVTPDGTISNLTTGIALPEGGTVDSDGIVYVSAWNTGLAQWIEPDGTKHTLATGLAGPTGQAISPDGAYLYVAQYSSNSIAKVDRSDGSWTTFASGQGIAGPDGVSFDEAGNLYIANFLSSDILRADPSGNVELVATLPGNRTGYCEYRDGVLYVAGNSTHRIYAVLPDGTWSVLAGTGVAGHVDGPALSAQFNLPNGIAVSVTGDTLFVADNGPVKSVRRIVLGDATAAVETLGSASPSLELRVSPNPFAGRSSLSYELPRRGTVSVGVYDVRGRMVRTLVSDREQSAGRHQVTWDGLGDGGAQVPGGVYFVRVACEGDVAGARWVRRER
ncbi:MAG: SMP-30/gluconolactonase/LRE family protein [Gemmatimonadetes bacterium]|nr:SMP-30/gluconolactonase/LRE family protein [Gemmatimonadota bacterium]